MKETLEEWIDDIEEDLYMNYNSAKHSLMIRLLLALHREKKSKQIPSPPPERYHESNAIETPVRKQ